MDHVTKVIVLIRWNRSLIWGSIVFLLEWLRTFPRTLCSERGNLHKSRVDINNMSFVLAWRWILPSLQAALWIWDWREWQYLLGLVCSSIVHQVLYWKGALWLKQLKMGTAFLCFMVLFQPFYPPLELWHAGTGCLQGPKLIDSINCSWFNSGCGLCQATSNHPKNRPNEPKGWKMQWNANEFNFLTKRSDFFEFRNNNVLNL